MDKFLPRRNEGPRRRAERARAWVVAVAEGLTASLSESTWSAFGRDWGFGPITLGAEDCRTKSLIALFLVCGCPKEKVTCDSHHLRRAVEELVETDVMKHWLIFLFTSGAVEGYEMAGDGETIHPLLPDEESAKWLWRVKESADLRTDVGMQAPVRLFEDVAVRTDTVLLLLEDWKRSLGLEVEEEDEVEFFGSFCTFVLFLHALASSEDVWKECEEKGKRVRRDALGPSPSSAQENGGSSSSQEDGENPEALETMHENWGHFCLPATVNQIPLAPSCLKKALSESQ